MGDHLTPSDTLLGELRDVLTDLEDLRAVSAHEFHRSAAIQRDAESGLRRAVELCHLIADRRDRERTQEVPAIETLLWREIPRLLDQATPTAAYSLLQTQLPALLKCSSALESTSPTITDCPRHDGGPNGR